MLRSKRAAQDDTAGVECVDTRPLVPWLVAVPPPAYTAALRLQLIHRTLGDRAGIAVEQVEPGESGEFAEGAPSLFICNQ